MWCYHMGNFHLKIFTKLFMNANGSSRETIIEWIILKSSTSVVGDTGTDFKISIVERSLEFSTIIILLILDNFQICEEFPDTQQSLVSNYREEVTLTSLK